MNAPTEARLRYAWKWIRKADNDLINARHTLTITGEDCPLDTVCFHAQQATEKYVKAMLVFLGIDFGRVHELGPLIETLPQDKKPPVSKEEDLRLSNFAVAVRYPELEQEISRLDATDAVGIAERIKGWALGLIPAQEPVSARKPPSRRGVSAIRFTPTGFLAHAWPRCGARRQSCRTLFDVTACRSVRFGREAGLTLPKAEHWEVDVVDVLAAGYLLGLPMVVQGTTGQGKTVCANEVLFAFEPREELDGKGSTNRVIFASGHLDFDPATLIPKRQGLLGQARPILYWDFIEMAETTDDVGARFDLVKGQYKRLDWFVATCCPSRDQDQNYAGHARIPDRVWWDIVRIPFDGSIMQRPGFPFELDNVSAWRGNEPFRTFCGNLGAIDDRFGGSTEEKQVASRTLLRELHAAIRQDAKQILGPRPTPARQWAAILCLCHYWCSNDHKAVIKPTAHPLSTVEDWQKLGKKCLELSLENIGSPR